MPHSTPAPKAVVFDLGKVLVDFNYQLAAQRLAPLSRLNPDQFRQLIDQSPLLHQLETGRIDFPALVDILVQEAGYHGSPEFFHDAFTDIFSEIPEVIALHSELRSRNVPTYLLSNTSGVASDHVRRRFPFFSHFNGYVLSHEIGHMKPAAPIYEALERLAGLRGPDLLYLDDRADNIEAALDRGWQAILHHDPAASVAQVRSRLGW
jgi:HAD superfamily hydrolase (TIGR01509 family)